MTFRWIEGFETIGDTSTPDADVMEAIRLRFPTIESNLSDQATLIDDFEDDGAFALQMPGDDSVGHIQMRFEFPSELQTNTNSDAPEMVVGVRVKIADASGTGIDPELIGFHTAASSNPQELKQSQDGTDLILDDDAGTETISDVLTPGSWHYIEVQYKYCSAANGGYMKIFVDGTEVFDDPSRSVESSSFQTVWGISLTGEEELDGTGDNWIAYDDLVIYDLDGSDHTGPIGPVRIRRHGPTADGSSTEWTPSSGSDNYALVDEVEIDESDYVETGTDGNIDRYELENSKSGIGTVVGVGVEVECINTSGGTPTLHTGLKNTSTDEEGTVVDDTSDNTYVRSCHTKHPNGSGWTNGSFDGIEGSIRFEE